MGFSGEPAVTLSWRKMKLLQKKRKLPNKNGDELSRQLLQEQRVVVTASSQSIAKPHRHLRTTQQAVSETENSIRDHTIYLKTTYPFSQHMRHFNFSNVNPRVLPSHKRTIVCSID
ncbi:hypothetical protein AVEN_269497-1 [Araneus ventricosus]|uniref:Uncharacterized protein n=1 Tax=Araneus ventricosus TaxID=182803 RepID=A0A4Y2S407_ARAVE|nr:hypothetical protein AVEN_259645-1 [Araneus ventricosus]GBN82179.1 hypothetical protein AVEN_269497-1 [Araneus ventricosus]